MAEQALVFPSDKQEGLQLCRNLCNVHFSTLSQVLCMVKATLKACRYVPVVLPMDKPLLREVE